MTLRSWITSPLTWTYAILPSHFSTPQSHRFHIDKAKDAVNWPTGWSPSLFHLTLIDLATIFRKAVDMRNASASQSWSASDLKELQKMVLKFILDLPSPYAIENARRSAVESAFHIMLVERWLLHQYIFSFLTCMHVGEIDTVQVSRHDREKCSF